VAPARPDLPPAIAPRAEPVPRGARRFGAVRRLHVVVEDHSPAPAWLSHEAWADVSGTRASWRVRNHRSPGRVFPCRHRFAAALPGRTASGPLARSCWRPPEVSSPQKTTTGDVALLSVAMHPTASVAMEAVCGPSRSGPRCDGRHRAEAPRPEGPAGDPDSGGIILKSGPEATSGITDDSALLTSNRDGWYIPATAPGTALSHARLLAILGMVAGSTL